MEDLRLQTADGQPLQTCRRTDRRLREGPRRSRQSEFPLPTHEFQIPLFPFTHRLLSFLFNRLAPRDFTFIVDFPSFRQSKLTF